MFIYLNYYKFLFQVITRKKKRSQSRSFPFPSRPSLNPLSFLFNLFFRFIRQKIFIFTILVLFLDSFILANTLPQQKLILLIAILINHNPFLGFISFIGNFRAHRNALEILTTALPLTLNFLPQPPIGQFDNLPPDPTQLLLPLLSHPLNFESARFLSLALFLHIHTDIYTITNTIQSHHNL